MIWVIIAGALATLIWYRCIKPLSYWKDRGVKQTKPWPILGDMWIIVLGRISFIDLEQKLYNMYPNERYLGFYQFTYQTLVLRDPELIKQLTVKDFDHFTDHKVVIDPEVNPLVSGMLFLLKGERWRQMRATVSGAFTSSKMKNIFHTMEETAEGFVNFFMDKNEDYIEVEMKDTYTRYANDVIATVAFGLKCDSLSEPNNEFYLMGKKATDFGNPKMIFVASGQLIVPKLLKVRKEKAVRGFVDFLDIFLADEQNHILKADDRVSISHFQPCVRPCSIGAKLLNITAMGSETIKFFTRVISETIKLREVEGVVRPDMINLLLEARKGINQEEIKTIETGFATVKESTYNGKVRRITNLTDELITSQAFIFFLAGFDTISTAMSFGSYELAVNKDIQDKLRNEIKETYEKSNGKITYEALLRMKYLDMVISEILRKWPASLFDRVCTKPYTIEPVNEGEVPVHLKPGDSLFVPIYALHRDPAYYPEPDKFDPERFSDENKDSIIPYTYLPFGSGPRNCIGSRFALLEMKTLFFNLLLYFEIVPTKKTQIPIVIAKKSRVCIAEGGFWFAFKRIRK